MKLQGLQIGRNEPCPCGSKKRYMDCCLNTKYLITYNYNNQAVLIDKNKINKNLRRIIALNTSLNKFKEKSFEGKCIEVNIALDYLKKVYDIINLSLEEVEKFSSCSKGCCACCNKYPTVGLIEVKYIKEYLKDSLGDDDFEMYIKKLEDNNQKKICPFLSDSGECIIYEVRPFACRRYLVFSDPEDCSNQDNEPLKFSDAVLDLAANVVEKLSFLLKNEDNKYTKMPI